MYTIRDIQRRVIAVTLTLKGARNLLNKEPGRYVDPCKIAWLRVLPAAVVLIAFAGYGVLLAVNLQ